jgi:Spy/CpxP family protein refolding chaperone
VKKMRVIGRTAFAVACAVLFAFVASGMVFAQARPMGQNAVRGWMKALKLSDSELAKISDLANSQEKEIAKARADIQVCQANIARLMLEADPDLQAIDAQVEKSLEAEKAIRMAQISRQIEVRKVLGEERWKVVLMLVREARVSQKFGKFPESFSKKGLDPATAEKWGKLLQILKRFM